MLTKEIIYRTRDKYLAFIRDWPEKFNYRGKNFKELFTLDGKLSLWWLSNMQFKDSEGSPVFKKLCQYGAGQLTAAELTIPAHSIIVCLYRRLSFLAHMLITVLIFKLVVRRKMDKTQGGLLWDSIYGETLKNGEEGLLDRYHHRLPKAVKEAYQKSSVYMSFYHGSPLSLIRQRDQLPKEIVFYEEYLSVGDLVRALDLKNLLKYIFIEKKQSFRDSLNYNGIPVFGLFAAELRQSYVSYGISMFMLLTRAVERIAREYSAAGLISFLEMYHYSRALYYGTKKGRPQIINIAIQHATITPTKLWDVFSPVEIPQMPIPDYIFTQGKMGRDIYVGSGYPAERCIITGGARFDSLLAVKPEGEIDVAIPVGKKVALVTTAYMKDDALRIIRMVGEVLKTRDDLFVIFKGHPHCPIGEMLEAEGIDNYALSFSNVHQLLLRSDLLITSYSMTADEAIALDRPVISVLNDDLIDMSMFFEIEAAPRIRNTAELNEALDLVLYRSEEMERYRRNWPRLIEESFYRIDGKNQERIVSLIGEFMGAERARV